MDRDTRQRIEEHWAHANARRWDAFAALFAPDLRYEVPQTREYAEGAHAYVELFRTWPGDWRAVIRELLCEGPRAVCRIDFVIGADTATGISFFTLNAQGLIVEVTDWWPDPYEPPERATPLLKRRPVA
jgi:hypothetical protein